MKVFIPLHCIWRCCVWCCLPFLVCGTVRPALADGLIFQLPPDGTFVEFRGEGKGSAQLEPLKEFAAKFPPDAQAQLRRKLELKLHYVVTLSSVGQLTRTGQPCRWIELRMKAEGSMDGGKTEPVGDNILKVLVPEKFLKRGEDPLGHAVLTFFNPKGADKAKIPPEPGFNRIQYEIDRVRTAFPDPLQNVHQLPKATLKTPAGTFEDCEVIAGTTEFDRPLVGQGRWEFKNDWQLSLHKDAPFGVVELQCQSTGQEIAKKSTSNLTTNFVLTLSSVGAEAKSALPDQPPADGAAK